MNSKTLFSYMLVAALLLSSCAQKHTEKMTIKVLHTTDVHGAIFPYDFINDKPSNNSLAQVSAYVNAQRKNKNQEVILLDNGDILQGQPVVYYANFERTDTAHICSQVMNYMQYDAATVGNHDIEAGHDVYDKLVKEFQFPWLAANAVRTTDQQPYFKPYTIIQRQGIKIAVLGLITPSVPDWLPANLWEGMEFNDMIESARYWVEYLQKNEKPDILIGMFHAGIDYTYNNQSDTTYKNENATVLIARQVKGFDLILAGHDHRAYNEWEKLSNGNDSVLIVDALTASRKLSSTTFELTWNEVENKYDKKISAELVDMAGIAPDSLFMSRFGDYMNEVKRYVNRKIGVFTKSASSRDALFGDAAFVDIVHNIQRQITGAQISFAAPLSFDATIAKGNVYVRDMFKLYRYENLLYTIEMTGQEIDDFLEYSYGLWFNQMKSENDNLILFKKDTAGNITKSDRTDKIELANPFFNFDSGSGIKYVVDVSKPVGERVNIVSMSDGKPFDHNQRYKVAINSYRANGGGGHITRGAKITRDELQKRVLTATDKDLRYYMMKWIEQKYEITPEPNNNWQVIPTAWYNKALNADKKLLYANRNNDK